MTYRELLEELRKLDEEQLSQEAVFKEAGQYRYVERAIGQVQYPDEQGRICLA